MELFRLFGSILIDDKKAIEALKGTDSKAKNTAQQLGEVADKGLLIGAAVVGATAAAVGGLIGLANQTSATADKWNELAKRTDMNVENLQAWGFAASQSGADIQTLERGIKTLSDSMVNAQNGSKAAQDAYTQLGISMQELSTMTPEQAFERTMFALAEMEDGALKNSIGNDLLGKSYVELKPLLKEGADGMQALKDRAKELGIVLSEDAIAAGDEYGDTMDEFTASMEGVRNEIVVNLLPKLTDMLKWFIDNMPAIKEKAGDVFGAIEKALKGIADNSNILIPILAGLAGAFVAMKVVGIINALMVAYTAFTTTATGAQVALNVAMMANPIGLVILAIAALIAIGVALWMNWDTVKEKFIAVGERLKSVFEAVKSFFVNTFDAIKTKVSDVIEGIKAKFESINDKVVSVFQGTVNIVKDVVDKIKGFFKFEVSLPKIKLPRFSIKPSGWELGDLLKGSIPKLGIEWFAKGGIFDRPTIFPTASGFKGVGEAGPEAVTPISALMDYVRTAVKEGNNNDRLVDLMETFMERMMGLQVVMSTGEVVGALASPMDMELRRLLTRRER